MIVRIILPDMRESVVTTRQGKKEKTRKIAAQHRQELPT